MLNRNEWITKKTKILIPLHCRLSYRVYKCTAILHVPMERAHRESSIYKLDYDIKIK